MSSVSIKLPKLYYSTGESVHGKVHLNLKSDRRVNGIVIHLSGSEFCETSILAEVPYQRKWILDGSTTLFGNKILMNRNGTINRRAIPPESSAVLIKAGNYTWPFSFQVPKSIPPSCMYKNGKAKIDYVICVIVDTPWSKSMKVMEHIRVGIPYVIDPDRVPTVHRNEKSYLIHHSVATAQGRPHTLKVEAAVDKAITYTGDKIGIKVHMENFSGRSVHALKCKLKQVWVFGNGFFEKGTVSKIKHKDSRFPFGQGIYDGTIPLVVPNCDLKPTVQNATLIRATYHLTVIATVRGFGALRVRLPIIIGAFPPLPKGYVPPEQPKQAENTATFAPTVVPQETGTFVANLIDWDEPIPEQQNSSGVFLDKPLQPQYYTNQPPPLPPKMPADLGLPADQRIPADVRMPTDLGLPAEPIYPPQAFNIDDVVGVTDERDHSFNNYEAVKPPEKELAAMSFHKQLKKINDVLEEFDSTSQWAGTGCLSEDIETPEGDMATTLGKLNALNQYILNSTDSLVKIAQSQSESDYVKAVKASSGNIQELLGLSKTAAFQLGDNSEQQNLLQNSKAVALAAQQLVAVGKEVAEFNPFDSSLSNEFLQQLLAEKANAVREACAALTSFSQQINDENRRRMEVIDAQEKVILQSVEDYNNPFGPGNEHASVESVEAATKQIASTVSLLALATHGQYNNVVDSVVKSVANFHTLLYDLKGIKGTGKFGYITPELDDASRALANALRLLMNTSALVIKQGNLNYPIPFENEIGIQVKGVHHQTAKMLELAKSIRIRQEDEIREKRIMEENIKRLAAEAISAPIPPPVVVEPTPVPALSTTMPLVKSTSAEMSEDKTDVELMEAVRAIDRATERLRLSKASSPVEVRLKQRPATKTPPATDLVDYKYSVMGAADNVGRALSELLSAARMAQNQRVALSKSGQVYHHNPTWTEGLISAAKNVVLLMEQLSEASTAKDIDESRITALSRAVSGATVQLVTAERVKGDPSSEGHLMLVKASKAVAATTSELISKAKEAAQHQQHVPRSSLVGKEDKDQANSARIRQEIEAAARVAKLEKELNDARKEIEKIRQKQYEQNPNVFQSL